MTTAPNAAPKNIAATDATLLGNRGLLPFASEESAPMPVIVVSGPLSSDPGLRVSGQRHSVCPSRAPSKRLERTVEKNLPADRLGIRWRKKTQQTERLLPAETLVPQIESVNRHSPAP